MVSPSVGEMVCGLTIIAYILICLSVAVLAPLAALIWVVSYLFS